MPRHSTARERPDGDRPAKTGRDGERATTAVCAVPGCGRPRAVEVLVYRPGRFGVIKPRTAWLCADHAGEYEADGDDRWLERSGVAL